MIDYKAIYRLYDAKCKKYNESELDDELKEILFKEAFFEERQSVKTYEDYKAKYTKVKKIG